MTETNHILAAVNVYKVWVRQARVKSDALQIYNIIEDFDEDLIVKLHALSESQDFMIFEDRKLPILVRFLLISFMHKR